MRFKSLLFFPAAACALFAEEPTVTLAPVVVTATRSAQSADTLPVAVTLFTASDLRTSPSLALDDALRSDPSFSLFRRTGSLTANPTAQGVSLRGLGPSGASRSLVLLDGVPLNDPFGGWVAWTKLPKLALAGTEIVHGGGSGAWGNAALGGTVQLLTAPPSGNHAAAEAFVGDFDTRGGEVALTASTDDDRNHITVDAAALATDGVYLIRQPGPIDRAADLAYRRAQATFRHAITDTLDLTVTARLYDEDRGNGTPLQRNSSEETFVSATLTGSDTRAPTWSAVIYAQDQSFASFFSSVNPTRTAETPASNQYGVPATAAGAALTATWGTSADDAITTLGFDTRLVQGETHEAYGWNGTLFVNDRRAGGEQAFAGLFARHDRALTSTLRASAGTRLDYWRTTDGFRRERNKLTNTVLTDSHFADRDGTEFNPNLGLVWQPAPAVRARASAYQAFRVPTLNEYYRPFRVGPVTTNANPALSPESLTGFETGLDLGRPDAPFGASLTAFVNELSDAVTNVTIAPNTRERRNLDHVRVQGLEASLRARPHHTLTLEAAYLFTDARVTDPGSSAPASLEGNRLAQVPRHTVTTSATWNAPAQLLVTTRVRWFSAQYEDDENTLTLAPATTVDLGVSRRFGRHWDAFIAIENLFNTQIETGRTTTNVVSLAPPRWSRAGLRYDW
ncbi:MAG: TonB-dependent receptor [Opitutaceae bacterium]|jgi:outer membrane receptor protein involved in Fe transport